MNTPTYVLVTAAYNEERHICDVIQSVFAQTLRPSKWIIVSDGSTDNTDQIVNQLAQTNSSLELLRICEPHSRNFAAQVNAINRGVGLLKHTQYDFIGNIDADITLPPDYFARILEKFGQDSRLGLAGGTIYEPSRNGVFKERRGNSVRSVAHGCQLFRRECFQAVGGAYVALPYGGPDTYAEVMARMREWRVRSFPDLVVYHHRRTSSVGGILRGRFRQGKMDYSLGALPAFEMVKLLRHLRVKPYVIGALARLAGFLDSYRRGEGKAVSDEFVSYLRREQRERLRRIVSFIMYRASSYGRKSALPRGAE